eukprot:1411313-Prymnesium_polylepis.1
MAQRADQLGERGSGYHPRPVRGCWSHNISVLQLAESAGRLAGGPPPASKPVKGSRGRWGMRLGPLG